MVVDWDGRGGSSKGVRNQEVRDDKRVGLVNLCATKK